MPSLAQLARRLQPPPPAARRRRRIGEPSRLPSREPPDPRPERWRETSSRPGRAQLRRTRLLSLRQLRRLDDPERIAERVREGDLDLRSLLAECEGRDDRQALIDGFQGDLRGLPLAEADLRGANLRGANLGGADLREARLGGANLDGANLAATDLRRADLRDCPARGCHLEGAWLDGADLRRAELRGAGVRGARLHGADLRGAGLRNVSLHAAYADRATTVDHHRRADLQVGRGPAR